MISRARALSLLPVLVLASSLAASAAIIGPLGGAGFAIPNNDLTGASSTINNAIGGAITDVTVTLDFGSALGPTSGHSWIGDLTASLSFGGTSVDLFSCVVGDNAGGCAIPGSPFGDSSDLLGLYSFNDAFVGDLNAAAAAVSSGTVAAGNYFPATIGNTPTSLLAAFGGLNAAGSWTLKIVDKASGDTGGIVGWSLTLQTRDASVPEPGTVSLLALGLVALGVAGKRRFVR